MGVGFGLPGKWRLLMRKLRIQPLILVSLIILPVLVRADTGIVIKTPHIYEVRYQVQVTKNGGTVENLRLAIPVFLLENLPPYQRILGFQTNIPSLKMKQSGNEPIVEYLKPRWGNNPGIRLEFVYRIEHYAVEYKVYNYSGSNKVDPRYLQPEPGIESDDLEIVDFATRLAAGESYPLEKAIKLFYYVNSKLLYQAADEQEHSALRTLRRGYGVCEDYSLLYTALCRAVGIPARFVNGFRFDPTKLGKGENDLEQFGHAWVEVNLPGVGWVPVEPTFLYTVNGEKKVNYNFFGKLLDEDRHLLFSYARQRGIKWSWRYSQSVSPEIKVKNRITIKRIR
jgi:transglutaminase-like putative cysteine protease